jgi:hypothetical protein
MEYTLTYSQAVEGWVSFYSYNPDWIIGMNNYLYTFKGGDIYKHNSNDNRNTFYEQWWAKFPFPPPPPGPFVPSRVVSVFNASVLENKLFKTINLEGDSTWTADLYTDLQDSGFINAGWFEMKEASYFAFIRNNENGQLSIRSTSGIGRSIAVNANAPYVDIEFSISPLVSIGGMISIGDYVYFALPPSYNSPQLAGSVHNIIVNYPLGINKLEIDPSIPGAVSIPINDAYILYVKNSVAESHGVLGHYCVFDITNGSLDKIELFAVNTEVMKSFP